MGYLRASARSSAVLGAVFLTQVAVAAPGAHAEAPVAAMPAPGVYTIANLNSGKCLGVGGPANKAEGAVTLQWVCLADAADQKWELFQSPDVPADAYSFKNVNSGLCLTVSDAAKNGSAVVQSACKPNPVQGWRLGAVGTNFQLKSYANSNNLDVTASSTADGARVVQWTPSSNPNQVWVFKPVA
ncbi:RICIN domain-containing protein [Streptomyces sp. NPDC051546]|uniref:RICIN domain-containing protein n=1 Tax=Streptomyces sp. NPDC051546 TaxID=3365655 RepID=UPI0037B59B5B